MTRVKICGIRRREDVENINQILPDYIGFVLAEKSRRYVSSELLQTLSPLVDRRVKRVGVFVDAAEYEVLRLLDEGLIDIAQLHGSEDDGYIRRIRGQGFEVIKSFTLDQLEDSLGSSADYLLFDYKVPGSGKVIDYSRLSGIGRPFFLAGGVSADNCLEMIESVHPFALDSSSALEVDGFKDAVLMKQFTDKVRSI